MKSNLRNLLSFCPWYTRAQNVCSGWPVYGVKCLCSRGLEQVREGCHSYQLFNIRLIWHEVLVIQIISSLDSKWQVLKFGMPVFSCFMKWNWRPLIFNSWYIFWSQWRYQSKQTTLGKHFEAECKYLEEEKERKERSLSYMQQRCSFYPQYIY